MPGLVEEMRIGDAFGFDAFSMGLQESASFLDAKNPSRRSGSTNIG